MVAQTSFHHHEGLHEVGFVRRLQRSTQLGGQQFFSDSICANEVTIRRHALEGGDERVAKFGIGSQGFEVRSWLRRSGILVELGRSVAESDR